MGGEKICLIGARDCELLDSLRGERVEFIRRLLENYCFVLLTNKARGDGRGGLVSRCVF